MTNDQLEFFIDDTHKDGFKEWAGYHQLKAVSDELMDAMMEECSNYCYDAVNLVFELQSSTSGMYSTWSVKISDRCTIYTDKKQPTGNGGTLNSAIATFILCGRMAREEYKPNLKTYISKDWPHTSKGNPI